MYARNSDVTEIMSVLTLVKWDHPWNTL